MISRQRYEIACHQYAESQEIMEAYSRERKERFEKRQADDYEWLDNELVYSASRRCECGAGLAYPEGCPDGWYWECSAVLKGVGGDGRHSGRLFFIYCDVEKEGSGGRTRG